MGQKTGLKLPSLYPIGKGNNAARDGLTTLILALTKDSGLMTSNGFCSFCIHVVGTNGPRFLSVCVGGLITILKIIGILQCEKKFLYFKRC